MPVNSGFDHSHWSAANKCCWWVNPDCLLDTVCLETLPTAAAQNTFSSCPHINQQFKNLSYTCAQFMCNNIPKDIRSRSVLFFWKKLNSYYFTHTHTHTTKSQLLRLCESSRGFEFNGPVDIQEVETSQTSVCMNAWWTDADAPPSAVECENKLILSNKRRTLTCYLTLFSF